MRYRPAAFGLLVVAFWGSQPILASAQGIQRTSMAELLPPISPAQSPGPLTLEACIELGFQHQPSLDAALASLAAAQAGKHGIDRLILARLVTPDLKVRRQQACVGISIAEGILTQAEWETRYAITRNFFTVQYVHSQRIVIDDVLNSLDTGYKRAKKIFDAGDPTYKITQTDLDGIKIQIALVKGKQGQARNGMLKAYAALREAMGLGHDYPLEIAATGLPAAVYEKKEGKSVTYQKLYKISKEEMISAALANRGEMAQANAALRVVELEIDAQQAIFGPQGRTFASGADIHVQPVPTGVWNGVYRPGGITIEMPAMLAGNKHNRIMRVTDLRGRAVAVVEKTHNLVSLDTEDQFLKWQEAVEDIQGLKGIYETAQKLPAQVEKLVPAKDLTGTAIIQANLTAITVRTQLNEQMHTHALALAGLERATAGAFRVYPVPAAPK